MKTGRKIKFRKGDGSAVRVTKTTRRLIYRAADEVEKLTGIRPNLAVLPPHKISEASDD